MRSVFSQIRQWWRTRLKFEQPLPIEMRGAHGFESWCCRNAHGGAGSPKASAISFASPAALTNAERHVERDGAREMRAARVSCGRSAYPLPAFRARGR